MDCCDRNGGRRLKDRLTHLLLRPANTFLRSPCSSSSSTSTVFTDTAAAATTISTSSTSSTTSTTAANYTSAAPVSRAEPFSGALDRLRCPPLETKSMHSNKEQRSTSSRHSGRRRFKKAVVNGGVRTLSSNPYGFTSSSEEEDNDTASYGDDDTETFLSSTSLMSSDSSGFYAYSGKLLQPPSKNKSHLRRQRRRRPRCRRPSASCVETCGARAVREPGFRPLVVTATTTATAAAVEQVQKGLVVVKRSRDPYGDFQESMVEMIMGRQVFGAAEMERLLRSYLLLNAPRFHPVILQAFSDVWVVLHGG